MKLTEKMSYLKGFIDALDIQKDTKEWKVIEQMTSVMDEMVVYIEDLQNQVDELSELCENLDEDLGEVEQELFSTDGLDDDDLDDYDDDLNEGFEEDNQLYETTCPTCGRTIILDESMLEEGGVECSCGQSLEFDFENLEDDLDDDSVIDDLDDLDTSND
ncbi:MAG: hypothetical protein KH373_00635 [Ruminococcus sp.]|nr:hypothetical protein [Ruminococcus sp.]